MAIRISTGLRTRIMETGLDDWYDNKILKLRTGTQPASANDAPVGTALSVITLPADAMGAVAAGVMSKAGTWQDGSADAAGTPTWGRIQAAADAEGSSTTAERMDFSVGAAGSGADMELDDGAGGAVIAIGDIITVTVATATMPAA